jgi:ankyrin repeat protein
MFMGRKIDINHEDDELKETALHKAVKNPQMRVLIVKLLLSHNASVNCRTTEGNTPLHYSVVTNKV